MPSTLSTATARAEAGVRYRYCTATYDEWAVPQCVGELTDEQRRRRGRLQRLIEQDGRVVRVETINSALAFYWETPKVTATEHQSAALRPS
jgi:hypothetical protein